MASKFTNKRNNYFLLKVSIPRMKVGKEQEIETLINEEVLLLAKFLEQIRASRKRIWMITPCSEIMMSLEIASEVLIEACDRGRN